MGKKSLALASFVMAIPAGAGFWFALRAALDYGENMPLIATGIVWTLVVLCLLLGISPLIFLIAGPSGPKVAVAGAAASEAAPTPAPTKKSKGGDEEEALDEDEEPGEPLFEDDSADAEGDFDDNFNFDDDEADPFDDEEEQPKKKKKKK